MHNAVTPAPPSPPASGPRRPRRPALVAATSALLAGLVVVFAATGGGVAHAAAGKTVNISLRGYMFTPMKVTIKPGTTVVWHWPAEHGPIAGRVQHTVTSEAHKGGLRFKSSKAQTGGTYSLKFTKPGDYYYECTIHPLTMQGEIIVAR